jgi:signal transduction histidine kinase
VYWLTRGSFSPGDPSENVAVHPMIAGVLRDSERQLMAELGAAHRLQELSTLLIKGGDIQTLYARMLDTAMEIMHSDCASMQVLNKSTGDLRLLAWKGFHPQSAQFWELVGPESATSCGEAARATVRVIVADTERCAAIAGTRHLEEFRRSGIRSAQSTPLLSRSGELLGMVSTHWRQPYEPSPAELRTFDILARQCADLIERKQVEEAQLEADRRKDRFLATLAHELRNPLAPLRNGLAVMKAAADQPQVVADMREMMQRQVDQLVHLVDDLLDLSRVALGKVQLQRVRVDLVAVIRQAVEGSPSLFRERHVDLSLPEDGLYVDGDASRLTQVISNLLSNACKFSDRYAPIRLWAGRQGNEVLVSVRDQGIGIPPEKLHEVFEIFAQLGPMSDGTQAGLGIGLSLVKQLVELHGGSVMARSDGLGHGSEFIIRLPAVDAAPVAAAASSPHTGVKRRVLVVDDNRDAAESLSMLLQIEGSQTEVAYSGAEALLKGRQFRPEFILLDLGMPAMNGYDACAAIRREPWGSAVKIMALSGWAQEADRVRSAEAGFDGHMVKPVDPAALARLLIG